MGELTVFSALGGIVKKRATALMPVDGDRGWITLTGSGFSGDLEPFDWQRDIRRRVDGALSNPIVFACLTLIAGDIGKMRVKLMQPAKGGVWEETQSSAFSPVLSKPNPYQTWQKFIESWILSKMSRGNSFILKERDNRNVVVALHVLDPSRCWPMLTESGDVLYEVLPDYLAKVPEGEQIMVPASEIMHDRAWCLFHPLCGLPPLFASGLAADQALRIMLQSKTFFANMSRPSGTLVSPGFLTDEQAEIYKKRWEDNYGPGKQGRTAILGNGLKYEALNQTALDSQLVQQLDKSAEVICSTMHVPGYKVGVGPLPPYQSASILDQIYYDNCLQTLIVGVQSLLDDGLQLANSSYKTELDLDDLLRMDELGLTDVLTKQTGAGITSPNEARKRLNRGPVAGGESPKMQQQNYSLSALDKRDKLPNPFVIDKPTSNPTPSPDGPASTADPSSSTGGKAVGDAQIQMVEFLHHVMKGLQHV